MNGSPILGTPTLRLERPPRRAINSFQTHHLSDMELEDSALHREYLDPFDVHSACRMLVYRDGQIAGWLGVHRRVDQPLCDGYLRRDLERIADPLRSAICAVDALHEDELVDGGHYVLLRPNGVVEFRSPPIVPFLTRPVVASLSDAVRRVDAGDPTACVVFLGGMEVHISRICNHGNSRYLARFSPPLRPELDPVARLTDAQRAVVEYAAAGATNAEIADAIDRSPNTVKGHLKAAYEELGLCSRVELAELLTRHRVRREMKRR